jgi:ACT domain-containing protein
MRCVLSVLGKDITGIVARVATTLAESGANIVDIRQSLLGEIFSMTMIVDLDEATASFNEVQERLDGDAEALGVQIKLQREDLFLSMYKI